MKISKRPKNLTEDEAAAIVKAFDDAPEDGYVVVAGDALAELRTAAAARQDAVDRINAAAKEKPQEGIVRVLGTGKTGDDGKKIAFEVKVGDRVLVSKYGGTEIKLDGKEYKIFGSDDLVAILN